MGEGEGGERGSQRKREGWKGERGRERGGRDGEEGN